MSYKTTFAEALALAMKNLDERSNAPQSMDCEICGAHKELYKVSGLEICAECLNDTRGQLNCCVCECNTNLIVLENDFICKRCQEIREIEEEEKEKQNYSLEDDACDRYHSQF